MSDFYIYGGGNAKDPYNISSINRVNDNPPGRYFVADARRYYVPQFYFDGANSRWFDWQEEIAPSGLVVGDRIHTNLILEGTDLFHVVVHVKRATTTPTTVNLVHTGTVGDTPAAGVATEVVLGSIDLTQVGYHKFPVDKLWQTDGTLLLAITAGNLMEACITVSPALVHHNDGHGCECYRAPCVTEYPDPNCAVVTTSAAGAVAMV